MILSHLFVLGCGVCHSDLHVIKGEIPFSSPCVIGHEITGEVVEHGPLTDHKITERFYIHYLCSFSLVHILWTKCFWWIFNFQFGASQISNWISGGWSFHHALW